MTARRTLVAFLTLACLSFSTARAGDTSGPKNITFDDIKLDLKKDEKFDADKHLTDKVEKLDGKKVKIRGWIHPASVFTTTGVKRFILVRDNQECCFGPGAALHDCISVTMSAGNSTDFTTKAIAVEGVFSVEVVPGLEGRQLSIYKLIGDSAK
jgi:hypothetical protein